MFLSTSLKLIVSFFFAKKRIYFEPYILLISFLLTVNKYLLMKAYEHLEIMLLAVLAPIKIIFILLFYLIFFKKKYTILQYIAIFGIIFGNFLIQFKTRNNKTDINLIYIFCSILANLIAASAMIIFDRKIREKKMGYWNYMYNYTLIGLIIIFFELILEFKISNYHFLPHLKNWKFSANILMSVAETFLTTYLVFNLTPLERGINANFIIVSNTFISNLVYKEILTAIHVSAVLITYAAIVLFEIENHKNKKAQKQNELNR